MGLAFKESSIGLCLSVIFWIVRGGYYDSKNFHDFLGIGRHKGFERFLISDCADNAYADQFHSDSPLLLSDA